GGAQAQAQQCFEQRGLAGAVLADETDDVAGADFAGDAVEDRAATDAFAQPVRLQQVATHGFSPSFFFRSSMTSRSPSSSCRMDKARCSSCGSTCFRRAARLE